MSLILYLKLSMTGQSGMLSKQKAPSCTMRYLVHFFAAIANY